MAITKKYRLIKGTGLMTYFSVNGVAVPVSFRYGSLTPFRMPGWFMTSDEDLQKAIEESNGYNVQYELDSLVIDGESIPKDKWEKALQGNVADEEPQVPEEVTPEETPAEPSAETPEPDQIPAEDKIPEEAPAPETPAEVPAETPAPEAPSVTDYPEVTSVTKAKQKLVDLFDDVKISTLKNKNDVLKVAEEKKVSFSNLK